MNSEYYYMHLDLGPEIRYFGYAIYLLVAIFGVILGSFLNSWIWRKRENIRIIGNTRSICIHCHHVLSWYDNIPLLSYLLQNGKCRYCSKKIPFHYFLVELITPILLVLVFRHCLTSLHFSEWRLLRNIFFLSFLVIIFKYDWLYREIPSDVVWAGVVLGLFINYSFLNKSLFSMLLGSAIMGGFFLAQYLISKGRWIGGGDVRLGFMFGVWLGWPVALVSLFVSYILGAIVAVGLLVAHKVNRQSEIPFGTFLAVGVFGCLMWGDKIVKWYMMFLGK